MAFIRVLYMNPNILGIVGPGFLNHVPTLGLQNLGFTKPGPGPALLCPAQKQKRENAKTS